MELTLALGFNTVAELETGMSVAEFEQWYLYRRKQALPARRMEYYMAQIALQISHLAQLWGGPQRQFHDFMFDEKPVPKTDDANTGAAAIGAIAGGVRVIKLGQKRKKRG